MWRRLLDLLRDARRPLVVVDFETAGLGGAPPVEFAVLAFAPWEQPQRDETTRRCAALVPPGLTYAAAMRLDPLQPIDPGATAVHKIADADVRGKETPYTAPEVREFFRQYASGEAGDAGGGPAVWCGHNAASADVPWATRWGYLPDEDLDVVDTMRLVRRLQKDAAYPMSPDIVPALGGEVTPHTPCMAYGLDAYASSLAGAHVGLLGWRPDGAHGALADACATARVLARALELWAPLWPPGRQDLPAAANLSALLAALGAPPRGQVSWDGWLAEATVAAAPRSSRGQGVLPGASAPTFVWAKGNKHKGRPVSVDPDYRRWVASLPRRPTGNDGEAWCSQHTADILAGSR